MTCPICDTCEGPTRANWPMPDSPLSFFGPETWLDDEGIDRGILASRLSADEYDSHDFAAALGIHTVSVRRMSTSGQLPRPAKTALSSGGEKGIWTAGQVAEELRKRKQRVPA